jgi:uncharacterized protein involved in response to NO
MPAMLVNGYALGRQSAGPRTLALWSLGLRPLYLVAGAYAALAVPLWAMQYAGWIGAARASAWHAHEMLFGYAVAVMVGFLFTAGRNWSGRATPTGPALMALTLVWLAARVLAFAPWPMLSGLVGVAFPLLAALGLGRALVGGANRRNYFFVAVLLLIAMAQGLSAGALAGWLTMPAGFGLQIGLDALLFVMAVMGGRVIPMFSNHGAPGTDARRHPLVERCALASLLLLALADGFGVHGLALAAVLALAALSHAWRLALWHSWRTRQVALVWILHAAYLWIVLHLALRAASALDVLAPSVATHALTVGAIGSMTLGMMTRTARGHLGQPLRADYYDRAMYTLVSAAALWRVALPLAMPSTTTLAVCISGAIWAVAFGLFVWRYGPWLCFSRADGLPG